MSSKHRSMLAHCRTCRQYASTSSIFPSSDPSSAIAAPSTGNSPYTAGMRNAIGGPCYHCGRTASPCWRRGPPDKPVLCNACGARWLTKKTLLGYTPGQHRGASQQATPEADDDCSYNLVVPAVLKRKREHAFRSGITSFQGPPLFLPPPVERSPQNVSNSSHSSLSSLTLKAPADDSSAASTMDSTAALPAPTPLLTNWQQGLNTSGRPQPVPANSSSPVSSAGPRQPPLPPPQQKYETLLAPLAALRSPLGPLLLPQQQQQQQQAVFAPALPHRRPRKQQRPQPCGAI